MSTLPLAIALPLAGAFALRPLARVSKPVASWLGPLLLTAVVAILLGAAAGAGGTTMVVALGGFAAPLGIALVGDALALVFALAVPLLSLLFWPWADTADVRERSLWLLLAAAGAGMALAGDLFTLYVFYELAAVASFGLAAVNDNARSEIAALRYLLLSALGSLVALVGIALVYNAAGTLNLAHLAQRAPTVLHDARGLAAFACLLVGFGVKAEVFPVNSWVPEVYATAPARVSALLAGLVSKLALLVIVRLLLLVFTQPEAALLLLAVGVLGLASGELAAWHARDFPRMLAGSSIAQLGLVCVAFSISGAAGVLAGVIAALHHLVVKSALFDLSREWSGALDQLAGVARRSPLAGALFVLFALSLVGLPPLPGFWAKLFVLRGLMDAGSTVALVAAFVLLAVTVVEANYLFRLILAMYRADPPQAATPGRFRAFPAALLGGVLLVGTVAAAPIGERLGRLAQQAADRGGYIANVLGHQSRGRL
ncbi:MAG: NADH-quinone oxidoreductase subunit J [Chromatiales bacterium]|nr:NADH-quinone oxidoreductase subunit J [Chromatiales bacterium]